MVKIIVRKPIQLIEKKKKKNPFQSNMTQHDLLHGRAWPDTGFAFKVGPGLKMPHSAPNPSPEHPYVPHAPCLNLDILFR